MAITLDAGSAFPTTEVSKLGGGTITLGQADDWQLIIVYRGQHCPICKKYAKALEPMQSKFADIGVSVALVSGDPEEKAQAFVDETGYTGAVGYDLSIADMQTLGLFVSDPRSPEETDRPFAEPGLYVVNADGNVQMIDVSNAPFLRPDLEGVLNGIKFVRDKGYPIRGTHA
ncbi:redoxin domain-containing protein [Yoonia sp. 208BN28-4]|uniref:redoxin domain-containing protein n=1 Tax=Yoonia sp. 208BN28-4 TaxID=3126505 RepID=UPI0030AA416B